MNTKRWIDDASDADELEREVLRSGLDEGPPAGAEGEVWRGILSAIGPPVGPDGGGAPVPPAAPVAAAGGAAAKAASTLGTLAKGFVAGIGVSVAVAGGARLSEHPDPPLRAVPTIATGSEDEPAAQHTAAGPGRGASNSAPPATTQTEGPRAPTTETPPARAAAVPVPSIPQSPTSAIDPASTSSVAAFPLLEPAALRKSQLEQEAKLLERARAELRSGALAAAFATLEASRSKFSLPELYQEREALAIELLHRSGQQAAASERVRAFVARFPESPHAARLRGFMAESR